MSSVIRLICAAVATLLATTQAPLAAAATPDPPPELLWRCPVEMEIVPGVSFPQAGMVGGGWDGAGAGSATINWHIEGFTPDEGNGQRQALIDALQTWADIVQITFVEVPTANRNQSIDVNFVTGDHSASEPAEAGDPDCPFNGPGGVLAHAGFPPGINSTCINPMAETYAGNVHFDEADGWEQDNAAGSGPFSLELIGAHEIGHAIGLTHSFSGDIMQPFFSSNQAAFPPSANDTAFLQAGYASGSGSVTTLEQTGIWVDLSKPVLLPDWGIPGLEFRTVTQGVNAVPPFANGVTISIQPGTYNEAGSGNRVFDAGATGRRYVLDTNGSGNVIID